jgi:cyclase
VLQQGFEKIVLGRISLENPNLIDEMAKVFGSQSVVVCVDVEKKLFGGSRVRHAAGSRRDPNCWIHECIKRGAGEIILQSVDRDGTRTGYDLSLYENLSADISVPVIALGGAGSLMDVQKVLTCRKVHSAAAGSLFVHQGPHRAVLISYPERTELQKEGILS